MGPASPSGQARQDILASARRVAAVEIAASALLVYNCCGDDSFPAAVDGGSHGKRACKRGVGGRRLCGRRNAHCMPLSRARDNGSLGLKFDMFRSTCTCFSSWRSMWSSHATMYMHVF